MSTIVAKSRHAPRLRTFKGDSIIFALARAVTNGTALELADVEESNLTKELARRALAYVNRPRAEQPQLSEAELEKVRQAVLTGEVEQLQCAPTGCPLRRQATLGVKMLDTENG